MAEIYRRLDRAQVPTVPRPRVRSTATRRDLGAGLGDGASFSVMVGIGETYLPAFALAAGMGEIASGLVATIPLLIGSLLQLAAPWALQRCGSFRRWIVPCAALQGLIYVPLLIAALGGRVPMLLVFGAASLYWGAGLATGPAWSTWMGTIVPTRLRASYFAKRTKFSQAGFLAGFVAGGVWLQWGSTLGITLEAFAALFFIATAGRMISVCFLASHSEPVGPASHHRMLTWRELRNRFASPSGAGVLVYFLAVQTAVQLAGPYFNPYMLTQLKLPYWQYVVLVAAAYVSRIIALPSLGRFAQRYGAKRLLWVGGIGIAPLSAAWLISNSFGYLIALQLTVGVVWAAYELSTFLLFFEAVADEERTSVLTAFNLANAAATVAGSVVGGLALTHFGKTPVTYLTLFAVSSVARFAALILLPRTSAADSTTIDLTTIEPDTLPVMSTVALVGDPARSEQGIAA
jgi:MFS family permease